MVARPIGAIFFGHLGDRARAQDHARGQPAHDGHRHVPDRLPADVLLGRLCWPRSCCCVLRLAQGFALGGEWSGAALVATENAPAGKRAWYGTFPQLGAPLGFIIANGIFLIINFALPAPRRTRPAVRGLPGLGLARAVPVLGRDGHRRALGAAEAGRVRDVPKRGGDAARSASCRSSTTFRYNWRELILGTFIMLATYVLFYLMTSFTLDATAATAPRRPRRGGSPFDAVAAFYRALQLHRLRADADHRRGLLRSLHPDLRPGRRHDRSPAAADLGHGRDHRLRLELPAVPATPCRSRRSPARSPRRS